MTQEAAVLTISFRPVDADAARAIAAWRHPGPYARYSQPEHEAERAAAEMQRNELRFFVFDHDGRVAGFCSFGADGRVPGGDYDDGATDVGAGLAPELTGQGLGGAFLSAVVAFARDELGLVDLRATIASWNQRAIRAACHAGFREVGAFRSTSGLPFTVLRTR